MKRKFWIALLPLCGCFCVEAGAQSLSARPLDGGPPRAGKSTRVSGAYLF